MNIADIEEELMPSAFNEREREAIRRRLREAALGALRRGGLGAASVADLAKAASIAKGSFYAFYDSKEELFMEALESIEDVYRARFTEAALGDGLPADRLKRAFTAAFELLEAEPALSGVDAQAMERLARALPPERVESHIARDAEEIGRISAAWRADGLLAEGVRDEDVAGAGYAVFLVGLGLRELPGTMKAAVTEVVSRGLALCLSRGFNAQADSERNRR